MSLKILNSILWVILFMTGCTKIPGGLEPVTNFNLDRYLGKWYEIARLDHSFERNLTNVSAVYTRKENGDIRVLNKGYNTKTNTWKQIEGRAHFIGDNSVGSLKVSFFGPFYGGYHILVLDHANYDYAMVAGPSRSYLWILSRQKTLDRADYEKLVEQADSWGFDTQTLIKVDHDTVEG